MAPITGRGSSSRSFIRHPIGISTSWRFNNVGMTSCSHCVTTVRIRRDIEHRRTLLLQLFRCFYQVVAVICFVKLHASYMILLFSYFIRWNLLMDRKKMNEAYYVNIFMLRRLFCSIVWISLFAKKECLVRI